jgi:peptide-methionine (S)-S-oxide reductase
VIRTRVGYAGGEKENPTYRSLGNHTETFQVDFDPSVLSFEQLVTLFWESHNPCSAGGSTQYKKIVFYHSPEQKKTIEATRAAIEEKRGEPVRTEIRKAPTFWSAEDYHQKYRLRSRKNLMAIFNEIYPDGASFRDATLTMRVNAFLANQFSREDMKAAVQASDLSDDQKARLIDAMKLDQ